MNPKLRSLLLKMMLSAYIDWKHPSKYNDTPKYRQQHKESFYKYKKMYMERKDS